MQTLNKFCCCKSYIWIIVAVRLSPCRFLNFSQDNFKASLSLGFQLKSVKQKGLKIVCQSFLSTVTQILGLLKCWPLRNLNTLSKVLQSKTKSNIRDKILMFLFLAEKTNQHFIISAHVFSYDIRLCLVNMKKTFFRASEISVLNFKKTQSQFCDLYQSNSEE